MSVVAPAAAPPRWLFGAAPDLLLGCGLGYLLFLACVWLPATQHAVGPWLPLAVPALGLLFNTPHYGATLLRVYERREDRRYYAVFSVWITLLIWGLFVLGLHVVTVGSLLLTAYITWSPWHFAGQNYGLALMFLRRRQVPVDAALKRLLYASFLFSYGLTVLLIHGSQASYGLAPVPVFGREVYDFLPIGIPASFTDLAMPVFAAGYVLSLAGAAVLCLRRGRPRDLLPAASLVLLQAVWFSIPAILTATGRYTAGNLALSTVWVAIFHSIQYLWICTYYARRSEARPGMGSYLGKTLLAGAAVTTFPALVFSPPLLGTIPFQAGLGILLFSTVNLHHFVLDGAIWKLRDGRVARVLLRQAGRPEVGAVATPAPIGPRWTAAGIWAIAGLSLAIAVYAIWEMEFGVRRPLEEKRLARVIEASNRLRWIGRESHAIHQNIALELGRLLEHSYASESAWKTVREHFERSIELYPSPEAWTGLGSLDLREGHRDRALADFDHAIALDPGNSLALRKRGEVLLDEGRYREAEAALDRAAQLAPDDPAVRAARRRLERERKRRPPASEAPPSPERRAQRAGGERRS
jgi:hypothetical protein